MSSLKLNGVEKVFPSGSLALYGINLEANDKEFIVILGGEASGKSTLLRAVAGLEEVTSGEIFIGDKNVTEEDPKERDIAMVFRGGGLYPSMTVAENLAYGLKLRRAPQTLIDQRVRSAANILGLNEVLSRKPKALSAQQKQRVAIGRAMVREPKLYLFDEPLSGLDGALKSELLNLIINIQARMQGTFLYATKNVAEAMTIGTRVVVLKNGIMQQADTPCNLYDYPENAYVAFLIGSPSINFINGARIVKRNDGVYAKEGGLAVRLTEGLLARFGAKDEYIGSEKRVIMGLRPEDMTAGGGEYDAEIKKTENGYAECALYGHTLTVKAEGAKEGPVKLSIDGDRLYLFDMETRLTLLRRDGGYVSTGLPQSDYRPMSFAEENAVIERHKPAKENKKKK